MAKSAAVPTSSGRLSTLKKEFGDLLKSKYPTLTDESLLLIPHYGSENDSVIFLIIDETLDLTSVSDQDMMSWIKDKKAVGIGSLFSHPVWTLDPNSECLCDGTHSTSMWGCEEGSDEVYLKDYDPYGLMG